MAAGEPGIHEKKYRIIERLSGGYPNRYELQKRGFFRWRTVLAGEDCKTLREELKVLNKIRKRFIVIEEFDL